MEKTEKEIKEVYDIIEKQVQSLIEGKSFDKSFLYELFKLTMEASETKVQLTGEEKQKIVLIVVKKILETLGEKGIIPQELNKDLIIAVDFLGPSMINLVIAATKKILAINKQYCAKCCNIF